jgi:hypothetical protein
MIAFGKTFMDTLKEANVSLTQYFILYCYVYDKEDLLKIHNKEFGPFKDDDYFALRANKYITLYDEKWIATDNGETFIKDHVDSYADQKADNPFLGEQNLTELSDDIYKKEFAKFLETYPTKVIRSNGRSDFLKEGTKEIKKLYLRFIQDKQTTPQDLQLAIQYYVKTYVDNGNMAYMKTLKNWLSQEIWRDVLKYKENIKNSGGDKIVDYGGKIE